MNTKKNKNITLKGEKTMKNTLVIDNFLIFDHAEIDINKFTVFIGQQASGKSIAAKLLYFFYHFPEFIYDVTIKEGKRRELNTLLKNEFCEIFPKYAWSDFDFSVKFSTEYGDISIVHQKGKVLSFNFSDYYNDVVKHALALPKKFVAPEGRPRRVELSHYLNKEIHNLQWGFINNAESSLFIPAGRSFFATLSNNIFTFLSSDNKIDYFLRKFGVLYEWARDFYFYTADAKNHFDEICKNLLFATHFKRGDKDFLKNKKKNLVVETKEASSGQQELLPILFTMIARRSSLFIIEEPEAHIFPESQSDIIRYIVSTQIVNSNDKSFLFTTHSPYVLTTLNNLAYAGVLEAKLRQKNDADGIEKLNQIYPIQERIPEDALSAYYFNNGKIIDIVDNETGLINAEDLDKISDITSDKFSDLLALDDAEEL